MSENDFFRFSAGRLLFNCPGCEYPHSIAVSATGEGVGVWKWDGNEAAPTVAPSLLCTTSAEGTTSRSRGCVPTRCHLFLVAGKIQFLGDSTHALAGQVANPLPLALYGSDEEL